MGVEEEEEEEAATGEGQGEGDVAEVEEEFEMMALMGSLQSRVYTACKRYSAFFSQCEKLLMLNVKPCWKVILAGFEHRRQNAVR